ncbi:subclass B3 metallo-beta-lactamase [Mucilaginibacter robiniae]|uniref:Subclass B3 metallo-beta-lactamase n=1 Tax=Mucilaginibacter robiniae TaxID=2728022 RepID=A0A7L5E239_9SPHI|nr:subclass B3 metallo-beta-lactamase [Mucilaginibacter robiniae]QJD96618.1 subclass B3 metallo-beta-lactamase [Mucilaginibacter robiniae]
MLKHVLTRVALIIGLLKVCYTAFAQPVKEPRDVNSEWSKSYPPFRIVGNLYYVGTYDLACYLITTPKGNILINTGLAGSLPLIQTSIEALGFKLSNTKVLLTMQAHYDHMGAMAAIKKLTDARMMVDEKDVEVMEDGGRSDYALGGDTSTYMPLKADRLLHNGDIVKLGGMKITMLHHPGHTKGSCSFLFTVKDEQSAYRVLLANMPTIVTGKRFSAIPDYPEIASDYAYTLHAMKNLSFDVWLSSHASQFGLHTKHHPGDPYNPSAFIDQKGYDAAIHVLQSEFDKKLQAQ